MMSLDFALPTAKERRRSCCFRHIPLDFQSFRSCKKYEINFPWSPNLLYISYIYICQYNSIYIYCIYTVAFLQKLWDFVPSSCSSWFRHLAGPFLSPLLEGRNLPWCETTNGKGHQHLLPLGHKMFAKVGEYQGWNLLKSDASFRKVIADRWMEPIFSLNSSKCRNYCSPESGFPAPASSVGSTCCAIVSLDAVCVRKRHSKVLPWISLPLMWYIKNG